MNTRETDNFDVDALNEASPTDEPLQLCSMAPGYSRYFQVKGLLEKKYGMKINHDQMGAIFSEILKIMPHERRVKKKYGDDNKGYWKTRTKEVL